MTTSKFDLGLGYMDTINAGSENSNSAKRVEKIDTISYFSSRTEHFYLLSFFK